MSQTVGWLRRQLAGVVALLLVLSLFLVARLPAASAAQLDDMASRYAFAPTSVALPGGFPTQTVRKVNRDYRNIAAWISSVGSGVALNDLDGDGLANDLCVTDPRTDQVSITPAPGAGADRYRPFALTSGALPMTPTMAPMGCLPGDFNEDGRLDLLVYLWGRTPIIHLARADAAALDAGAYEAIELVPGAGGGSYTGPLWNSNTAAVDDFDGDGHEDIYIGNYFPDGPVLDDTKDTGVAMNHSMSRGLNGGEDHVFRWTAGTGGARPTVSYAEALNALPQPASRGWALASGANDLDGDHLPELYLAHDFGPDRLLHNRSTPGRISFAMVSTPRAAFVPKSKRVGADSFKGMGIDFGDLDGDGMYDMFVSNITASFGLEESHFAFINDARDTTDVRRRFRDGVAPFSDRSAPLGLAWSGWGWDAKLADFNNSGDLVVAQTTGFVKGEVNRWPQLQELAMSNDQLLSDPLWWPHVVPGDDIGGSQRLHFFARGEGGRYADLAGELGLDVPVPTRGIAVGDTDGDGRLDFAVARQWDEPVFYQNRSPSPGAFLGLRLIRPAAPADVAAGGLSAPGSPVIGAQVTVRTPDGRTRLGRVDGGSGHSGKRSQEVHIGLGADVSGPVQVHLTWRDRTGQVHEQELQLNPGRHTIELGTQALER